MALSKIAEAHGKTGETLSKIEEGVKQVVFIVTKGELAGLREAWREAYNAVDEFRKTTMRLAQKPELRSKLEIDEITARMLATAKSKELSAFGELNEGTKAYAALLSIAKGGIYGHAASILLKEGRFADLLRYTPSTAHNTALKLARSAEESVDPSRVKKADKAARAFLLFAAGLEDEMLNKLGDLEMRVAREGGKTHIVIHKAGGETPSQPLAELTVEKDVVLLVGGSLFEELRRRHEEAFRALKNWLAQSKKTPEPREVAFYEEALRGAAAATAASNTTHVSQRRAETYGGLQSILGWLASDVSFNGNYSITASPSA